MKPMTREELRNWFEMRGVNGEYYMESLIDEYIGKTEDEMDEIYDRMHGSMA